MAPYAHDEHPPADAPVAPSPVIATEQDPVCGMSVSPSTAAEQHEWGGRVWHFCSSRCAEKFRADPARHAEPSEMPVEPPRP